MDIVIYTIILFFSITMFVIAHNRNIHFLNLISSLLLMIASVFLLIQGFDFNGEILNIDTTLSWAFSLSCLLMSLTMMFSSMLSEGNENE